MNIKDYMTLCEAAAFLGVSMQTLRSWEKRKKLIPARNPINNWRLYKKEDLEAVLANIGKDK